MVFYAGAGSQSAKIGGNQIPQRIRFAFNQRPSAPAKNPGLLTKLKSTAKAVVAGAKKVVRAGARMAFGPGPSNSTRESGRARSDLVSGGGRNQRVTQERGQLIAQREQPAQRLQEQRRDWMMRQP